MSKQQKNKKNQPLWNGLGLSRTEPVCRLLNGQGTNHQQIKCNFHLGFWPIEAALKDKGVNFQRYEDYKVPIFMENDSSGMLSQIMPKKRMISDIVVNVKE